MAVFAFWIFSLYHFFTVPVPAYGGRYTEGIIGGQPMHINPLFSSTNETDADLTRLIYSGLFKYNKEGEITEDLAESWQVSEDKQTYTVYLKKNILWHDGEKMNAEDVLFTLNAIQDPAYKSYLRYEWNGIEVKQIDDYTLEFHLEKPYFGFLENLTVGILPKHIWENISAEKFPLADYNLKPIGTGPFMFDDFQKDSQGNILNYQLRSFENYYAGRPYINQLWFSFYPDEDAALIAMKKKEILGIKNIPHFQKNTEQKEKQFFYRLNIPRYFVVLFNQTKSFPLAESKVREALVLATNKNEIIEKVLDGEGQPVQSPFLPQMKEFSATNQKSFDLEKAKAILEEDGWKLREDGIREKDGKMLKFELFTVDWDWFKLGKTADILKEQWKKVGAQVEVKMLAISDLQQNYIRPREFQALLVGQEINFSNPDPYLFWHSSQKRDPGLNWALFEDDQADKILEEARQEMDVHKRIEIYTNFQNILFEKNPAIFLYSPYYIYLVDKKIQGIEIKNINSASDRFLNVNQWYIKTKRTRK